MNGPHQGRDVGTAPETRKGGGGSAMIPKLATDLWLLTHPDLRRTARVHTFFDFVAQAIEAHSAVLVGEVPLITTKH